MPVHDHEVNESVIPATSSLKFLSVVKIEPQAADWREVYLPELISGQVLTGITQLWPGAWSQYVL